MSGVSDIAFIYCHVCERYTAHDTDWDSEVPDRLYEYCLEHNKTSVRKLNLKLNLPVLV